MKMVKACLPPIRLRFGTKPTFDTFTYEQQLCSGVAHELIEHHELDPAVTFVQPQMIGQIRVYSLKRIGHDEDRTDILGGFWRGSRSFPGMTAAEAHIWGFTSSGSDHFLGIIYFPNPSLAFL